MKRKLTFVIITAVLILSLCSPAFAGALSVGSEGSAVYTLQQYLAAYGFFYDEPTGYYGSATESAVAAYQYYLGLEADGIAGPTTLAYLGIDSGYDSYYSYDYDDYYGYDSYDSSDNSNAYAEADWYQDSSMSRALSNGMAGNDVYLLQSLLADYGYFYDSPTGFFGDMTEAAVINFQYDYGLTADGIAGPGTISMLTGGSYESYEDTSNSYNYVSAILDAIDRTPSTAAGYCASWVTQVLLNAGVISSSPGYNANDYWAYVCYSTDLNDLQPGMVIATRNSYSYLGSIYGHVGFYIGDGLVISSVGYKETLTVDEWISRYNNTSMGSFAAWGFPF